VYCGLGFPAKHYFADKARTFLKGIQMPKKILVVDDEINILSLIVLRLQENNYEVFAASDGMQAVKFAHDRQPDLIILDLKMPAGGGMGAYEKLKMSTKTALIPIIFITAYGTEDIRQRLLDKGARDFITKPFKNAELLQKVKNILGE